MTKTMITENTSIVTAFFASLSCGEVAGSLLAPDMTAWTASSVALVREKLVPLLMGATAKEAGKL